MSIIVTPGEKALIEALQEANVKFTTKDLKVGDIHIKKGEDTVYIIERKAKGDLNASITGKGKRYKDQKGRLLETGLTPKNIIYLIEQLSPPQGTVATQRIWSAMVNSFHRDGITVFQTKNIKDSVKYLSTLAQSVNKFEHGETTISKDVNIDIKKRQVQPAEWFKYSLTLIPKCSLSIATVITDQHPTLTTLIEAIEESGMECLADLKHGGSQRRIGVKLSTEICKTVLNCY